MDSYTDILKKEALKNRSIFWDVPKENIETLSDNALLERILNYGDMEQLKGVVKDRESFIRVYNGLKSKERCNLFPIVINYIDLYLKHNKGDDI